MKFFRMVFFAVTAILAIAAAISALVYFKDEIVECLMDFTKKVEAKRTKLFHSEEFTDYADI
ncbi:hypothetical protein IZU99_08450 [Oscillospiraceae bacterium CM]|nr:hypothetical protein IZU99_08450 [Oscillospiraceae bacterium CM]